VPLACTRRRTREAPTCIQGGGLPRTGWSHDELKEHHISEPRINDRIRVAEVRLVGPNGEQVGIVRVEDALRLAQDADLDLVEVAPDARPPVCKIMDFGKFKYEADMKAREARRNQTNTVLKEIRFRLKIDPHDYGTKKGHVERFLSAGDKVKVMIMFRGREQSRPEMGIRLLQRLADDVSELGFVESAPKQDGRNMIMVLGPVKKKAEQKSELRRAAQTRPPREDLPELADLADLADLAEVEQAPVRAAAPVVSAPVTPAPAEAPVAAPSDDVSPAPVVSAPAAPAPVRTAAPRPPAPARPSSAPRTGSSAPRPASSSAPRAASARPAGTSTPAARPATSAPRPASEAPRPAAAPASPAPAATTPKPPAPKPTAIPKPVPRPAPAGVKPAPRSTPASSSEDADA
jgi:translation initiation factor IF-3